MSEPTRIHSPRKPLPLLLAALAGLLVGAAVASGVWLYLLHQQEQRHQAELAEVTLKLNPAGMLNSFLRKGSPGAAQGQPSSEENTILEFGKAFVADLENNRLASAYRSTSSSYQRQMDRRAFDEMVGKYPAVKHLYSGEAYREYKVRKQADGKGYEFYCTARDQQPPSNRVNFALLIIQENGEWKVNELEMTVENMP